MTGTYSIDYIYQNNGSVRVRDVYPEWARTEKFYNCDNFTQLLARRQSLLSKLFGRKQG